MATHKVIIEQYEADVGTYYKASLNVGECVFFGSGHSPECALGDLVISNPGFFQSIKYEIKPFPREEIEKAYAGRSIW